MTNVERQLRKFCFNAKFRYYRTLKHRGLDVAPSSWPTT